MKNIAKQKSALKRWSNPEYRKMMSNAHKGKAVKHGMSRVGQKTRFYKTWENIKYRCKSKKNYADRGIKNEWITFNDFYQDMYQSYLEHVKKYGERNTTIDRIDNDGNYSKENCHWATYIYQQNKKSDTLYLEIEEYKVPFAVMCHFLGVYSEKEIGKLRHAVLRGKNLYQYVLASSQDSFRRKVDMEVIGKSGTIEYYRGQYKRQNMEEVQGIRNELRAEQRAKLKTLR